jgi:hypothetical protein
VTSAELLVDRPDVRVYHAGWPALLDELERRPDGTVADAMLVDAPYSSKTHTAQAEGVVDAERGEAYRARLASLERRSTGGTGPRRALSYAPWTAGDVATFVAAWSPVVRGWFVSITDADLAPIWRDELEAAGRCPFAPLAFVAPGSRARLSGDGPSNWTTWIVVARPRGLDFARWGTLPGAYVLPPGFAERMRVVGGKPTWIMERLVEDYTRAGDLVVDPCCGDGTTLEAALRAGRRAVGGDLLREHAEGAAERLGGPVQRPLFTF